MSNNWLPRSSLTMVIISQPKSTGSRLIRDASVLLFTIHLEFCVFFKNMEANLFRHSSKVSSQQESICPLSLIFSDSSEPKGKRCQTSWSEMSAFMLDLLSKALETEGCITASTYGQTFWESPSPTAPQLGQLLPSCSSGQPSDWREGHKLLPFITCQKFRLYLSWTAVRHKKATTSQSTRRTWGGPRGLYPTCREEERKVTMFCHCLSV